MTEFTVPADPSGAAPAEATSGKVEEFIPGQLNTQKQKTEAVEKAPVDKEEVETVSKEQRHAAKKITELSESRLKIARMAIDQNKNAIYAIAEQDRDLAMSMLKEYEYGTEDLDELLAKKDLPDASAEEISEAVKLDKRFQNLEKKALNETVEKLQRVHPDLTDELEETFRSVYSDSKYESFSDEKKLAVARAIAGVPESESSSKAVLDMLKAQEGSLTHVKAKPTSSKKKLIPDESAKRFASAGVTEELAAKYLPDNIDELVQGIATQKVISE